MLSASPHRSSTRLHAPPGGGSAFGGGGATAAMLGGGSDAPPQQAGRRQDPNAMSGQMQDLGFGGATKSSGGSNAFANGASQNTGNVISDRSSTRLHAPP
jgi:hypothetical protein